MDISPIRSQTPRWIWIASIWSGFGLIGAMQTVFVMRAEGMHHAWVRLFFTCVLSFLPWALGTGIVMRLARQFPPVRLKSVATWCVHLSTCAAIGLLYAAWVAWLNAMLNPFALSSPQKPFVHEWLYQFYNGTLSGLVLYSAILAVSYVLDSRSRLANQQTETARLNE
ncbi:MAG: two-component system, LytTR family, sensor kinase, partial [Acidobacteriaceae bacterium]|nr:two-component system, LytTR family, sensor kinase [Acidobacteriaceae bacterium]